MFKTLKIIIKESFLTIKSAY